MRQVRWNIDFFDWIIRLLFQWNSEGFKGEKEKSEEIRQVILAIHAAFIEKVNPIREKYTNKLYSPFDSTFDSNSEVELATMKFPDISLATEVEGTILVQCYPPVCSSVVVFAKSMRQFISDEKQYDRCLGDSIVIAMGFFKNLNLNIYDMIKDKKDWNANELTGFLDTIKEYFQFVNTKFLSDKSDKKDFLYAKFNMFNEIVSLYKLVMTKYYVSKTLDSDKDSLKNIFDLFQPRVDYYAKLPRFDERCLPNDIFKQDSIDLKLIPNSFFGETDISSWETFIR